LPGVLNAAEKLALPPTDVPEAGMTPAGSESWIVKGRLSPAASPSVTVTVKGIPAATVTGALIVRF
jgi:hypothetical protein